MNAVTFFDNPQPVMLNAHDFRLLDDSGAFDNYAQTELIEGVIVGMNAQFSLHARTKTQLAVLLQIELSTMGSEYEAICEASVNVDDNNQPMPDIVVGMPLFAREPLPLANVKIAIEVADTTLNFDLTKKADLYARVGIQEYWVVDLTHQIVAQMTNPDDDRFRDRLDVALGGRVASITIPNLSIETHRLLVV